MEAQLSSLGGGGASCTGVWAGACARDFGAAAGAAFFAAGDGGFAAGAGGGGINVAAVGEVRAGAGAEFSGFSFSGFSDFSAERGADCATGVAGSGVMMLIGGMDAALGKSPETGRPGGGTVPSAASGAFADPGAAGAPHDGE